MQHSSKFPLRTDFKTSHHLHTQYSLDGQTSSHPDRLSCAKQSHHLKKFALINAVLCLTKYKLLCAFKFQTRILSLVGGHSLQSVVSNMMKQLLTHQLSKSYNLTGAKGKASFRQHKTLLRVLFRELFSHTRHIGGIQSDS